MSRHLIELCFHEFWHESFNEETLSSAARMQAVLKILEDNGINMTQVEQPNMKFAVGDVIGKRTCSANTAYPNKKGEIMGYKKTLRRDGKPQWRYIVKLANGHTEEWMPGMVYLCDDDKAERVAFV